MHRALVGAFVVEMNANGHRPVDLTAHEAPLAPAPEPVRLEHAGQLKARVEAIVAQAAATSPVSVTQSLPAVLPDSSRGLRALSAATIRSIMAEKGIPCGENKPTNVNRLWAHLQKEKRASLPVADDGRSPLLAEGYEFPSRDESPVLTHVMSTETVAASVHQGLGDTRYVWFYHPWCLKDRGPRCNWGP